MGYDILLDQLQTSTSGFIGNTLEGLVAFCIFVAIMFAGLWVAQMLGIVLKRFLQQAGVEKFLQGHGVHDAFVGFTFSNIMVALLKLYVVVAFIGIAADVVKVPMIMFFAAQAVGYLPSLLQGLVILMVGLMAGDYITDRIKEHKKMPFANSVAIVIELFTTYFVNLVIFVPQIGHTALSIARPLTVVSRLTSASFTVTFFLHLTQNISTIHNYLSFL